jgi:uncharacterized membrane protein YqjE
MPMRDDRNNGQTGLLDPVWRLLDNVLGVAQNRVELFRVEAQEEKIRLVEMLLLTSLITVLATLSLVLGILVMAMMAWQHGLLAALAFLSLGCAIGAGLAWRALKSRLATAPFADFSGELRKDRQCIPRP